MLRKPKIYFILKGNAIEFMNKIYDLRIYYKFSFHRKILNDKEKQEALLFKLYHIVEKGLSLPEPRPGFGKEKIFEMLNIAHHYLHSYGENELTNAIASSLKEYINFNKIQQFSLDENLIKEIDSFIGLQSKITQNGGTIDITKTQIVSSINSNFETFFNSRYSVRDYADSKIDEQVIEKAVAIARKTPSVCNRQSWVAHFYSEKKQINSLLELQNGNRGFRDVINNLIVVTTSVKSFTYYEGNQVFTDGGLFAMSLMLSLHSQGIATCALNTCRPYWYEKKLKQIGQIPDHERIIMMIALGTMKTDFKVTISRRKPVSEILRIH